MKNKVSKALNGFQITGLSLTDEDNIVMNFDNENTRGEAILKHEC